MMHPRSILAGILVAIALTIGASATPAWAADVQACLTASEKGQRARSSGKLREAREHFVICGAETCPALVRHDCAQWNSELASTLPTVVFGAKDSQGRDLFDVSVSMDGEREPLVKKLDGKGVTVDPGKHTFRFETPGFPPITEVVLIKEGERARVFNVTFDAGGAKPKPDPNKPNPNNPDDKGKQGGESGHTPYPWIVVGMGAAGVAVGIAIVVTTPERPSNCNPDTQKCMRGENESEADFRKDQERAGTADSQPILGYTIAGVGLAFVAGGLLWHFLEPTNDSPSRRGSRVRVIPWTAGKTAAGIGLGGTF